MTAQPHPAAPVLFEAVSAPPCSLSQRGLFLFALLLVPAAGVPAVLFALLGAWPVMGFVGAEIAFVLGLLATHRRWSGRAIETVLLTGDALVVRRADGRGGQEEAALDPYWARVALEERPGQVPGLYLTGRGARVEVGRFLSEPERRSLAEALDGALRRYRNPVFDNPQLRDG